MKAIIIDDEVNSVKALTNLLKRHCPEISVITGCVTAADGLEAIRKLSDSDNNIVFLDIEMPFMSGFELMEQLDTINFELIFTTAYNQYAIQAIKFSAIDYLLKPISAKDLITAVQRAANKMNKRISVDQIKQLTDALQRINQTGSTVKIALPSVEYVQYFYPEEIIRCEAHNNYSLFIIKNHPSVLVSKNLGEYEHMLAEFNFIRVHKSHLVNMRYIKKYIRGDGGQLLMEDGALVDVSRSKKDELLVKLSGH